MTRTPARRTTDARRALIALLMGLMVVTRNAPVRSGSGSPPGTTAFWQVGRPVPIAVRGGPARFVVPTPGAGSRTLVVVSALSRGAGPYPIELAARGVPRESLHDPETEPESPARPPRLSIGPLPTVTPPVSTIPPTSRTFHLMVRDGDVASASNYVAVEGTLRAVGQRVQVYVDRRDNAGVGPDVLRDLVATFDERVFPVAAREIGQARDVDGDGRFTVLMSGWLTRLAGGRHTVDGFVRGADANLSLAAPFSNHCDMMYLSTALTAGPHLRTVVAHEYTHAVAFSAKPIAHSRRGGRSEEEGWLDEALAHLVEDRHGFSRSNLNYRVSAFLSRPERYRLVVEDYYAADLFRSHGNRGSTYLFMRWCVDRYGPSLIASLIRSDRLGVPNLEGATGVRFADLYRAWSVALYFAGVDAEAPSVEGDLAGPRTFAVEPEGPALSWWSAGTASRYLIVGSSASGAVEVTVSAPPDAALQVTAVPLPDDLATLEMQVRATNDGQGAPGLQVDLCERNGTAVRLSALSWEPLVPGPDPHAPGFHRAALDAAGIAAQFGTSSLAARGRLSSKFIPASGALDTPRQPLVFKAIGTDARGRRVAAWAELGEDER